MYRLIFSIFFSLYPVLIYGQDIPVPKGYTILDEKEGDLDKDGNPEKAIVYNTSDLSESGTLRELRIFKKIKGQWSLWRSSRHAVGESEGGGMMGDPFESIEIKNGILQINQSGGSSWKWSVIDKYRFQNGEFEWIGYSGNYGKPCEYWTDIDFNLSTGQINYKKEIDKCEGEKNENANQQEDFLKKGIKLNLNNRNLKSIKIISPKHKYEINL